ncbi:hypothetical protein [Desulfobacter vibrioformis]|uniref:hypothetical protein n=1 Tax=Desulfobacter vibrioformis TaxID=34031 RepID=UPI0005574911|nr:hypothetical protein [Desulfobacter vibrioformis]
MSDFENCLSQGLHRFIEKCSLSLIENRPTYSQEIITLFLYTFKFLNDKWSDTTKPVRTLKKNILEILYLLLICQKQIKDKISFLKKTGNNIEENWSLKLADFPFIEAKDEKEIINQISSGNIELIDFEFSVLNFGKELSRNKFLEVDPAFVEKIEKQFDISKKNIGRYTPQNELLLKTLFTGIIKNQLGEIYPGITILLPLSILLKEIEKINSGVPGQSLKSHENTKPISFKVPGSCSFPENFLIKDLSEGYRQVPDWARWLFHAGEKMAAIHQDKKNIVLGLSLPTRAYAALFFLLGFETWNAIQSFKTEKNESEYFNKLTQVEENTPLLIWDNQRWKRCFAKGIETVNNQKMFCVNVPGTDNKGHIRSVTKEGIFRVRKAVDPKREVGVRQLGYSMRGFEFLQGYYGQNEEDILNYLISNKSRFALVGNKTVLKNENDVLLIFMKIWEKRREKELSGSLLDILRIDPFLLSELDLARGTFLSHETAGEYDDCPALIVFDGSLPFLNHYDDLDADMKVIIFDRSEPRFLDASRIMLDLLYSDRENEDEILFFEKLPESVEAIMFEE